MKPFIVLSFACMTIVGCSKKEECTIHTEKKPGWVVFSGYTAAELDTIYVSQYELSPGFTQLRERDTVTCPHIQINGGIAFPDSVNIGFALIDRYATYEIEIPAVARIYRLSKLVYSGDSVTTYMSESCPLGSPVAGPDSAIVDGVGTRAIFQRNNSEIVLQK